MEFYSNGKLLITGEYLVLDSAKALALPTKYGQHLIVEPIESNSKILLWESVDEKGKTWFSCKFKLPNLEIKSVEFKNESTNKIAKTLQNILSKARKLNPDFLLSEESILVKTILNFPINWGLGTSSTLINNIAKWANIDAFKLQFNTFGGSAYDIACAQNDSPIIYQLKKNKPIVKPVIFNPKFKDELYFVYLNEKKNSREAIKNYQKINQDKTLLIDKISTITTKIYLAETITTFEKLIIEHEKIISKTINITPIKEQFFSDYFGQIKSLGAWEGDFILVTGNKHTSNYFENKGFNTVIPFNDMILNNL